MELEKWDKDNKPVNNKWNKYSNTGAATQPTGSWNTSHLPVQEGKLKKKKKKSQPASVNLPFSFVSFIAVGTYETADRREVSNPCAVLSVQPTALCGLRVVLSRETTSWVMFVKVYLVFPQTMTALFM